MSQKFNNAQNYEDDNLADDEKRLEASLRAALYRQNCPTTMELGEYQLGLLAEPDAIRLKAHLDSCPHCQAELNRLSDFLAEEAANFLPTSADEAPNWTRGDGFEWRYLKEAGRVVIRLVEEVLNTITFNLQQGLQPATGQLVLGGLRGRQSLFEMTLKEAIEDFEAVITVEASRQDPTHCAITVEVNIPSRKGWPNLADTEVKLMQNKLILATQTTNAFGRTVFKDIAMDELTKLSFEITPGR